MKYRPILFSGEMVRAILDGRKTMTRRVVSPQPASFTEQFNHATVKAEHPPAWFDNVAKRCKYGVPGDRLWVKETFGFSHQADDVNCREQVVVYRAGHPYTITYAGVDELRRCDDGRLMEPNHFVPKPLKWYSPRFMPRWASRITLEIVSVKVERLTAISFKDCAAEGVDTDTFLCERPDDVIISRFRRLWSSLNAKKPGCSWGDNPWVWVVEFKVVDRGI